MTENNQHYDHEHLKFLEMLWGEGYLSPGGVGEVREILKGFDVADKKVLDIGCGAGGITVDLIREFKAKFVLGIDVEKDPCIRSEALASKYGLGDKIEIQEVEPGPFPFGNEEFDIVFSKDSIVHIHDKEKLSGEVFRILKPGGFFLASDWLTSHDGDPSEDMKNYLKLEDLDFGMASPGRYEAALRSAGFINITLKNRNKWYAKEARRELADLSGAKRSDYESLTSKEYIKYSIDTWTAMIKVIDTGEHCPHHFNAQKPFD